MNRKNVLLEFWKLLLSSLNKDEKEVKEKCEKQSSELPVNVPEKVMGKNREKDVLSKTARLTESIESFLNAHYDFRYNVLTEETEYRTIGRSGKAFSPLNQRVLNTLCLEAHEEGIACWDRDLSRCIYSTRVVEYHPFKLYLDELPEWDGVDRLRALARRVSNNEAWVKDFHVWMLGMTAQWMGITGIHANSVAPLLISMEQGCLKSTLFDFSKLYLV